MPAKKPKLETDSADSIPRRNRNATTTSNPADFIQDIHIESTEAAVDASSLVDCSYQIDTMRYITHHASFLPITTNLKPSLTAPSNNAGPYAVYHPRNIGTIPPNIQSKSDSTPHNAGCRMKTITAPHFTPIYVDQDDILSHPTVMAARKGQISIADTAGFVTLYTSIPTFSPIIKLHTTAGKRSQNEPNLHYSKRKKKIGRSNVIVNSSVDRTNAIEAVILLDDAVVLSTAYETECMEFTGGGGGAVVVGRQRWIYTEGAFGWDSLEGKIMVRGFPLRLDANQTSTYILASFGFEPLRGKLAESMESEGTLHTRPDLYSPLLMIDVKTGQFSNLIPKDEQGLPLNIATRSMIMFCQHHFGNLFGNVLYYQDGNLKQELMIMDSTYQILHRTEVTSKFYVTKVQPVEVINQSPKGTYSIVGTTKGGIRVYRTADLSFVGAYGEGVSLHGHHLIWHQAFFLQLDTNDQEYEERWGQIVERNDELQHREWYESRRKALDGVKEDNLKNMYIVSVSDAFREPKDMKDTIHFWDLSTLEFDGGNKMPSFTISAPLKSEGICSLLYDNNMMTAHSGRLIMSTYNGDCLHLSPTLTTDWAGQMYPKGYLVVDNNVTYIEDEDELDTVIDAHVNNTAFCQATSEEIAQDDMNLALQISKADELIDVVGIDNEDLRRPVIDVAAVGIISKSATEEEGEEEVAADYVEGIPSAGGFDFLQHFPQAPLIHQFWAQEMENKEKRKEMIKELYQKISSEKESPVKQSKRKPNNIDLLINVSVDKQLTIKMLESMGPSDGSGSRLADDWHKRDPSKNTCAACKGRSVIHACGKRARPIDYDGIAKAEEQKQKEEEAKKLKEFEEKRLQRELKRKEAKRKKMEEAERERAKQLEADRLSFQKSQMIPSVPESTTSNIPDSFTVSISHFSCTAVPFPSDIDRFPQSHTVPMPPNGPTIDSMKQESEARDGPYGNLSIATNSDMYFDATQQEFPQPPEESIANPENEIPTNIPSLPSESTSDYHPIYANNEGNTYGDQNLL